jgi:hypothetical protein
MTGGKPLLNERNFSFDSAFSDQRRVRNGPDHNPTEDDMMERLLAFLLAGTLVAPQISMASESGFREDGGRQAVSKFSEKLLLPPIPYLDTMPWMKLEAVSKEPGIDILMLPNAPAISKNSTLAHNVFGKLESQKGRTATR